MPHAEDTTLAEQGLYEWSRSLPDEDAGTLMDLSGGEAIHWAPGEGWVEDCA